MVVAAAYWSAGGLAERRSSTCSGGMNPGVPPDTPVRVSPLSSEAW
jgi:hypothetical protein